MHEYFECLIPGQGMHLGTTQRQNCFLRYHRMSNCRTRLKFVFQKYSPTWNYGEDKRADCWYNLCCWSLLGILWSVNNNSPVLGTLSGENNDIVGHKKWTQSTTYVIIGTILIDIHNLFTIFTISVLCLIIFHIFFSYLANHASKTVNDCILIHNLTD